MVQEEGSELFPVDYNERCRALKVAFDAFRYSETEAVKVRLRRMFKSLSWKRTVVYPVAYRGVYSNSGANGREDWSGKIAPFLYMTADRRLVIREGTRYALTNIEELAQHASSYQHRLILISLQYGKEIARRFIEAEVRKNS